MKIIKLLSLVFLLTAPLSQLAFAEQQNLEPAWKVIIPWIPYLFEGFINNIIISIAVMFLSTILGVPLGIGLISKNSIIHNISYVITQFFRNSPWLVLLFTMFFIIPFNVRLFGIVYEVPSIFKGIIGLTLPVMANISEVTRGAIMSIPSGQWEASKALGFTRGQQLTDIILPQCIKRMLPLWMNIYCILTMATTLVSIVGVNEVLTYAHNVKASIDRIDILVPLYFMIMLWFFLYSYPIAWYTKKLERKYNVKH